MNYMTMINLFLLVVYIYWAYRYYNKLKDTEERFYDNEMNYADIKVQMDKLQKEFSELKKTIKKNY